MPKTILLVDDSASLRMVVKSAIEKAGYQIVEAEDGAKGLESLKTFKPDLIISDINMPEMGGLEFIQHVRENPAFKFIPVIFLTTESDGEMKVQAKTLNVRAWMTKPFKAEQMISAIAKILPSVE